MPTGKEVFDTFVRLHGYLPVWEQLHPSVREPYEAIATDLNEHYVAPLQALVKAWQTWAVQGIEGSGKTLTPDEYREWNHRLDDLLSRSKELLAEENKQESEQEESNGV